MLLAVPARAELAPFRPPQPVVKTLANGLKVAVFTDSRLPIVQMQLLVPAGTAAEPAGQSGVAYLTAQMLRFGTTSRDQQSFADELDRLGCTLTANASRDYASVSASLLAGDFEAGLELLGDAVINPIFPDLGLEHTKNQAGRTLDQQHRTAPLLADDQLWSLMFHGEPYGRPLLGDGSSMPELSREQVRTFHAERYRPDRAVLAIAGDVAPERAFAAAEEWLGRWSGRSAPPAAAPGSHPAAPPRVRIVDLPGARETEIRVGLPAPPRAALEALALSLANLTLGGGPGSRLASPQAGFSHEARSALTTLRDGGLLALGTFARTDSAATAVGALLEQLRRLAAEPPAEGELASVRRSLRNSFPLQFETLGGLIAQWMSADFYGLPADALSGYRERVDAQGVTQVAVAVKRWVDPAHARIVAVGPASELKAALEKFGSVEVVSPESAGTSAGEKPSAVDTLTPPTPEEEKHGRAVVAQAIAAHGGQVKLRGVKDSIVEGVMTLTMQGQDITGQMSQTRKEPWKFSFATNFFGFASRQVLVRDSAWTESGTDTVQVQDADSTGTVALRSSFNSDLIHLLLSAADPKAMVAYRGHARVAGHDADMVEVVAPAMERRRLAFDASSHQLLAMEQRGGGGPSLNHRRRYRDYRPEAGILWPHIEERELDGLRIMTLSFRKVTLNSGVDDSAFKRAVPSAPRH